MKRIHELIAKHDVQLLLAEDKVILNDTFNGELCGWQVRTGEWHPMTIDSNVDDSAGLDGEKTAIQTLGSYGGGIIEKTVYLENYGEISFEHYVQNTVLLNDNVNKGDNYLRFYVDDHLKFMVKGPSPWYRCDPIGLTPGWHKLKFEYVLEETTPLFKKAVIDTVTIYQARNVNCLVTTYFPARPAKGLSQNKTLRGYTLFQEMTKSDTEIEFIACFDKLAFHDFMANSSKIFYLVDEFGVCYRGVFANAIEPKVTAWSSVYHVSLTMIAACTVGVGFC